MAVTLRRILAFVPYVGKPRWSTSLVQVGAVGPTAHRTLPLISLVMLACVKPEGRRDVATEDEVRFAHALQVIDDMIE